jgi:hypothetical protein
MPARKTCTIARVSAGLTIGLIVASATIGTASATAVPVSRHPADSVVMSARATAASVEEGCGYLGGAKYRHCDGGSGSTVMLDVRTFWGDIGHYCVGPGITNLQPVYRWVVTNAWWNGGWGCQPGKYS